MMLLLACFMADADLRAALKPADVRIMEDALKDFKKEVDQETAEELTNLMKNLKIDKDKENS